MKKVHIFGWGFLWGLWIFPLGVGAGARRAPQNSFSHGDYFTKKRGVESLEREGCASFAKRINEASSSKDVQWTRVLFQCSDVIQNVAPAPIKIRQVFFCLLQGVTENKGAPDSISLAIVGYVRHPQTQRDMFLGPYLPYRDEVNKGWPDSEYAHEDSERYFMDTRAPHLSHEKLGWVDFFYDKKTDVLHYTQELRYSPDSPAVSVIQAQLGCQKSGKPVLHFSQRD